MPPSVGGRIFLNGSSPTPAPSALFDTNLSGTSSLFARILSGTRESYSYPGTSLTSRTTFASVTAAKICRKPSPSSGRTSILIFDFEGARGQTNYEDAVMNAPKHFRPYLLLCSLGVALQPLGGSAQSNSHTSKTSLQ